MRTRSIAWAVVLAVLAGAGRASACSQCLCGSPTPPGYLLAESPSRFGFALEDLRLSKRNALDEVPGTESQEEHRISASLTWRARPRLALRARVPYAIKRNTTSPNGATEEIVRTHGLGDGELLARFDVLRVGDLLTRNGALALIGAFTAPTGANGRRGGAGARLEEHLQPGTGAWSGTAGIAWDGSEGREATSVSLLGRVNTTNIHGYQYGNAILFNLGVARALTPAWEAALELNGRTAAPDASGGNDVPNTGGTLLYASPSLRWTALAPVGIEALSQFPVARRLNGDQTERATLRLALVWVR